ncbi:hypothetical protein MVEN_02228600 [Mycena venus]|uniref:Uncharacterized protein n=1 Tax=Mycena venus TaxID=2733690 RepID=A0A8H6X721_9AGAR|nr:hypothetical protein MVEN_02228600 [Mycena venus]
MRRPSSLEDKSLLEDEPFKSEFSSRHNGSKKRLVGVFLSEILDKLEKEPGGHTAVEEWLKLAFIPGERARSYTLRAESTKKPSKKIQQCFVQFYWYLFCGLDAMKFLRTQNIAGYINTSQLEDLPLKEEPIDDPMSPLAEGLDEISSSSPRHSIMETPSSIMTAVENPGSASSVAAAPIVSPASPKGQEKSNPHVLGVSESDSGSMAPPLVVAHETPQVTHNSPVLGSESISHIYFHAPPPSTSAAAERRPSSSPVLALTPTAGPINNGTSPALPQDGPSTGPRRPSGPLSVKGSSPAPRGEIGIKADPFDQESGFLNLVNDTDTQENWLTRSPIETKVDIDDIPFPDSIPNLPKPPLERLPPIWAQARQEVCESFEWFRSYQGGVYQNNGSVKGYFLSAFSAQRDLFACDGKLIISHGGGKAETARKDRGQVISKAAEDQQAHDLSVRALLENHHHAQPLVLLIDDKYGPFPFDLAGAGVYMAVLGFYRIIHAWAEYQPSSSNAKGQVVRYKFAFQWCEGQGEPWWSKRIYD